MSKYKRDIQTILRILVILGFLFGIIKNFPKDVIQKKQNARIVKVLDFNNYPAKPLGIKQKSDIKIPVLF